LPPPVAKTTTLHISKPTATLGISGTTALAKVRKARPPQARIIVRDQALSRPGRQGGRIEVNGRDGARLGESVFSPRARVVLRSGPAPARRLLRAAGDLAAAGVARSGLRGQVHAAQRVGARASPSGEPNACNPPRSNPANGPRAPSIQRQNAFDDRGPVSEQPACRTDQDNNRNKSH